VIMLVIPCDKKKNLVVTFRTSSELLVAPSLVNKCRQLSGTCLWGVRHLKRGVTLAPGMHFKGKTPAHSHLKWLDQPSFKSVYPSQLHVHCLHCLPRLPHLSCLPCPPCLSCLACLPCLPCLPRVEGLGIRVHGSECKMYESEFQYPVFEFTV
jgi:hypothetical protein